MDGITRRGALATTLALALGATARALAAPAAAVTPAQSTVPDFVEAFRQGWAVGEPGALLPFFAPDAVINVYYPGSSGPEYDHAEYRGAGGWQSLRDGTAVLLGAQGAPVQVDLAALQTTPTILGGAPATAVRWPYRNPSVLPALPVEVGIDEVVLVGGRIAVYSRQPDPASHLARALATQTANSTATAAEGAPRPVDVQGRGTPLPGTWVVVAGVSLAGVIGLALLRRPSEAP